MYSRSQAEASSAAVASSEEGRREVSESGRHSVNFNFLLLLLILLLVASDVILNA